MKIKRVATYQTTDGQIFTDKKDAQAHQKELDRIDALVALVDEKVRPYGALTDTGATTREHLIEITFGELAQFIAHNADAIRALLPQRATKTTDEPTQPAPVEVEGVPTIENDMSWTGAALAGSLNALGAGA